uniref:START domain-containing protein 10 n=1 Tax=Lepeophtheirus salmonis TaxID=72036 RepID=A0A0K2VH66_LEPSM
MEVNEVRIAGEKDFESLRAFLARDEGWNKAYDKKDMSVWTRSDSQDSAFKMLRVKTEFSDVPASILFDVIQDPDYRKTWDRHMLEYKNIGYLNPCNDIGYYSLSCPSPMKNRDFVIQSSWLQSPDEYIIINHSVSHKDYPKKRGFIRGISYLTGFLIQPKGKGCTVGYVTHSNPKGKFPNWVSNKLSTTLAPKLVKRIHKACLKYNKWKAEHQPELKPWKHSEQIEGKKIDLKDCVVEDETEITEEADEIFDESAFNGSDSDD